MFDVLQQKNICVNSQVSGGIDTQSLQFAYECFWNDTRVIQEGYFVWWLVIEILTGFDKEFDFIQLENENNVP